MATAVTFDGTGSQSNTTWQVSNTSWLVVTATAETIEYRTGRRANCVRARSTREGAATGEFYG